MSRSATSKLPPLAYHILSPHPGPINCTTFPATKFIADDPAHPLYLKTQRRLALCDRNAFHFRVHCPFDISKKAVIRNTVKKTFEKAFVRELERGGWAPDGKVLKERDGRKDGLTGACLVNIVKDSKRVLQASREDVRSEMARLVDEIAERRAQRQPRPIPESWISSTAKRQGGQWGGRTRSGQEESAKTYKIHSARRLSDVNHGVQAGNMVRFVSDAGPS
ncbi:unnamed protein product [Zymoseptoria tritici ST99CH_3D7]|uniref:Uncharacterized protein n=1 Tax=Zymoseptoria tritici (strain ST99CH_3D7) TaxID=1276538 RepID=A0A1X7RSQ1_ZYMT9|nr:unnamed protein product [Zymoseptoria tritici ST99CH_3D7]